MTLHEMRGLVQQNDGWPGLAEFKSFTLAFLRAAERGDLTSIDSVTDDEYRFLRIGAAGRVLRPINAAVWLSDPDEYDSAFDLTLDSLRNARIGTYGADVAAGVEAAGYMSQAIYTTQQAISSVAASFQNQNQARKRVGQLFEQFLSSAIREAGLHCVAKNVSYPIPGMEGQSVSYEIDLIFSQGGLDWEVGAPLPYGVVLGSVKTTSKDRIDKVFQDREMLRRLLNRNDVPLIAVFLHDVQKAKRKDSPYGIGRTFKRNHFLALSAILGELSGTYYVDPRPEMKTDPLLAERISTIERLLLCDLWTLTG